VAAGAAAAVATAAAAAPGDSASAGNLPPPPPPPPILPMVDGGRAAQPRRSPRVAAAAGVVVEAAAAAAAAAATRTVWFWPDGPEHAPPPDARPEWVNPGPPPSRPVVPDVPTPLPTAAASWRTDLLVPVAAVAAHSAAPPSGARWAPPHRGRARRAPAATALAARTATADCPPHQ